MGGTAADVLAVVAPAVVVGDEPGVGFGLELADGGEVTAMDGRAPALLEHGALEAFAHRACKTGHDTISPPSSTGGRTVAFMYQRRRPHTLTHDDDKAGLRATPTDLFLDRDAWPTNTFPDGARAGFGRSARVVTEWGSGVDDLKTGWINGSFVGKRG